MFVKVSLIFSISPPPLVAGLVFSICYDYELAGAAAGASATGTLEEATATGACLVLAGVDMLNYFCFGSVGAFDSAARTPEKSSALGDAGQLSLTAALKNATSEYHANVCGWVLARGLSFIALKISRSDLEGFSPLIHWTCSRIRSS